MSTPAPDIAVPAAVAARAAARRITPVWRNDLGGITFRLGDDEYIKWMPTQTPELDFDAEAVRLRWAQPHVTVPRVIARGSSDGAEWLVTAAIAGTSAIDPRWADSPAIAARAIGAGLRHLHDTLPVHVCPFDWSVSARTVGLTPAERAALGPTPPIDRLVVCHGDACAPNTLVGEDGRFAGHVDLGSLGTADRWADLAVAAMSLDWNFDQPRPDVLFEAYGVAPDEARLAFYRRVWKHLELHESRLAANAASNLDDPRGPA